MDTKKKNILIIEDDLSFAEGLQLILEDEGYGAYISHDGVDINKLITNYKPEVLLIDYRLPVEDGISITKRLKKSPQTKNIPIILMSASQSNTSQRARLAGAEAFLSKPFEINTLLTIISQQIS